MVKSRFCGYCVVALDLLHLFSKTFVRMSHKESKNLPVRAGIEIWLQPEVWLYLALVLYFTIKIGGRTSRKVQKTTRKIGSCLAHMSNMAVDFGRRGDFQLVEIQRSQGDDGLSQLRQNSF